MVKAKKESDGMGGRYFITGAQLGILVTYLKLGGIKEGVKLVEKIMDEQYICDAEEFEKKFDWKERQVAP